MKVSVVGGGPAGSLSAISCASGGNAVTLYEEHRVQPVQCAGLISRSGLERLNIKTEGELIHNRVRGAKIYSPGGSCITVDGRKTKAYVFDRKEFDKTLLESAEDNGVTVVKKRVNDLGKLDFDKLILASGTNYALQRRHKLPTPKRFLVGAQYVIKSQGASCDPEFVELHFNIPEFFSWVIPVGEYIRVGCCAQKNPTPSLESFLKKRFGDPEVHEKNFGIIPCYDPRLCTQHGKILLVGDAAAQVKATTGGGVIMGGIAAGFTCQADYEKRWRSEIGRELLFHKKIHDSLAKLSEKNKEKLFSLLGKHSDVIEKKGDMDIASRLVFSLLKKPSFSLGLVKDLPAYLIDLLA